MLIIRLEYKTEKQRQELIAAQALEGFTLLEDQLHTEGNFLIFTDEPLIDLVGEIKAVKARLDVLEAKTGP